MLPVIFIDIAPNYKIPDEYSDISKKVYKHLNRQLKIKNDSYYKLFVYNEPIKTKMNVMESEYSYNRIVETVKTICDIRDMELRHEDNIALILMGKYSEYGWIINMLNQYSLRTNSNFRLIRTKPMYYYYNHYDDISVVIKKEAGKLNKYLLENLGAWH